MRSISLATIALALFFVSCVNGDCTNCNTDTHCCLKLPSGEEKCERLGIPGDECGSEDGVARCPCFHGHVCHVGGDKPRCQYLSIDPPYWPPGTRD